MLPLGRKNARKCSECDITCHANCAHLVPDFCGMSMETANVLLKNMRDINKSRGGKTQSVSRPLPSNSYSQPPASPPPDAQIAGSLERLKLTGAESPYTTVDQYGRPQPQSPTQDRLPSDPRFQPSQQPPSPYTGQQPLPGTRPPSGARVPIPSAFPQEAQQPGRTSIYDPAASGVPDGYGPSYPVCILSCISESNKLIAKPS